MPDPAARKPTAPCASEKTPVFGSMPTGVTAVQTSPSGDVAAMRGDPGDSAYPIATHWPEPYATASSRPAVAPKADGTVAQLEPPSVDAAVRGSCAPDDVMRRPTATSR